MKSPFPGMDPYLEWHWLDVQTCCVANAAEDLNRHLPDDLVASIEEREAVWSDGDEDRVCDADLRILEPTPAAASESEVGGAVAAPFRLLAQVEPITERFIRVIDARTERLITVIEFVSPTNKRGAGLTAFRSKRAELLACGVNFVEIDLVRAGDSESLLQPYRVPRRVHAPYRITIRIPRDPGAVYFYPISLREPLPEIVIPLRENDPEVKLALQPLLDRTYATGRYERRLNYAAAPEPLLEGEDAAWAEQMLRAQGKRN